MKQRQVQLLQLLYEKKNYMTAEELARRLGCSERTVRGDVAELRESLERGRYGFVQAKGNKGYLLDVDSDAWFRLMRDLELAQVTDSLRLEGCLAVLEQLFKQDTVKMVQLEQKLFTNYKNASCYVNEAEEWLKGHGLGLRRKRGSGLSMQGEGYKVRLAFWAFYCEIRRSSRLKQEELLQSFLSGIRVEGIRLAIDQIEEVYAFRFSYEGYERFLFLLFLMIFDYKKKRTCYFPENAVPAGGWEWEAADMALRYMRQWYQISFPDEERAYLSYAIASSEIMDFRTDAAGKRNAEEKKELLAFVRVLIHMVGEILQRSLADDKVLEYGLLNYLGALTAALRCGDDTCGCGDCRQMCGFNTDVAVACQSANHLLEEQLGINVTEYEIAVLASHFAGAVERNNITGAIYIVCNYGVGVSRFLCEQIKRAFPHIQVLGELTPRDLSKLRIPSRTYDLLITTVDLPGAAKESVVCIGNSLQNKDIESISKKLVKKRQREKGVENRENGGDYPLFEEELIFLPARKLEKTALIGELCRRLKDNGCVLEPFEESVLGREKSASTFLAGGVAIPHGLPEYVKVSRIAVALLDTPLVWNADETVQAVFLLALNLKSAPGVKESVVLFYRKLIAIVDEPQWVERLRELEDKGSIARKLNELIQEHK